MKLSRKHVLGIEELSLQDIELILRTAGSFREIMDRPLKKVPTLRGRSVIGLFYEPSTRTRSSFELAAKRLSADAVNISASTSSVKKGETLIDTGLTLEAMRPDVVIVRHPVAGSVHLLAKRCRDIHFINAGDGMHEHPTQALLDAMTIIDKKGQLEGLKAVIVGDIRHSRVARSNVLLLTRCGAEVTVCGPPTLIPLDFHEYQVEVEHDIGQALRGADVVMMLRTQRERQQEVFYPSVKEYFNLYGLNDHRMRVAKPDAIVMHPGPLNRGVEIDPAMADGPYSVILEQVTNGLAVRMAVLYLLAGSGEGLGIETE